MYGYCGKLLRVDLTEGAVENVPLDPEAARRFIGGSGLAAHLFFEEVAPVLEAPPGTVFPDPLGPENPLIIMTGPFTGTRLPAASRWTVSARSPLTGIWGEANVGGFFGAELRFAGYDGVIVTGRAAEPVYLFIDEGRVGLEPAGGLWGKDTYETDGILSARHRGESGARRPRVMAVGPAGENLVRYAAIVAGRHHAAGRTGLGAVMGSKNLKAVVVRGRSGAEVPAADPEALRELVGTLVERAKENMVTRSLGEAGTVMGMDLGGLIGDVPLKNWAVGEWPEGLEKVGVGGYSEYLTGTGTCYACPIACKRKVTVRAYGRELEDAPGAEYETLACLGPNLQIGDLPALLVAGEICNRLGLDTISAGITLGYAYEAADRGLLDGVLGSAEAGRLKGAWGDPERMLALLEDVAFRRGAGDVLAEGSAALADRIGRPEARAFLTTVKRLEAPAHDPRAAHGMAVAYAVSTRGACHMASLMYNAEHTGFSAPEAGIDPDGVQQSSSGKGAQEKAVEDLGCVFGQSAVLCQLGGAVYGAGDLSAALDAVTGFGLSLEDLLETGARIWHLKRGIANLYGVTSADDVLPPRFLEPLEEGGAAGSVPDIRLMLEEWREARGLDENGRARREVLESLGLGRLADLLGRLPAGNVAG